MSRSARDIIEDDNKLSFIYHKLFNTPDGKKVIEDLREKFYDRTSAVIGDPFATHTLEGQRQVLLHILETIDLGEDHDV